VNFTPDTPAEKKAVVRPSTTLELRSNTPSVDKRLREFVLIDNGLEVVGVSLGVVILSLERLVTLTLTARVITDLAKKVRLLKTEKSTNGIAGADEVEIPEELGVVKLFLKCQSGTRETGDEYDGWFGGVSSSLSPNFGAVFGLHELSE
jgi:hypothetical protein